MAYEPPALDSALAAAVGDDPSLVSELRQAFFESARRHAEALSGAATDAEWRSAALRLQGLAASFGAMALMTAAGEAAAASAGDRLALGKVGAALALCTG